MSTSVPGLRLDLGLMARHFFADTRPILESRSISSVARSKAKKDILIKLPIYDHWFAWPSFH